MLYHHLLIPTFCHLIFDGTFHLGEAPGNFSPSCTTSWRYESTSNQPGYTCTLPHPDWTLSNVGGLWQEYEVIWTCKLIPRLGECLGMRLLNVDLLSPTDEIVLYSYKHMYNSKQATVNVSTWHWLPRKHEPMLAKKHMQPRAYEML